MRNILITTLLSLLLWGTLHADPRADAYEKIRDRQYQDAVKLLEAELAQKETDELLYLLGNTCYLAGDYEKSRTYLNQLLQKFPESPLKFRVQYKIADTHIRQKEFEKSYEVYLNQVKRLTSDNRKSGLAQIYLKYADEFYKPQDPDTKPNYKKALRLYEEAIALALSETQENEVQLKKAMCQFQLKQYHEAIRTLEALKTKLPAESPQKTLREEVLFYLAENYFYSGQTGKARLLYKDFFAGFASSSFAPKALAMIVKTYAFPSPGHTEDLESGIRFSREFLEKFPTHELAPEIAYQIGNACFNLGQYDRAIQEFQKIPPLFRAQEKAKDFVASAEMMIGFAYYYQKKYKEATQAWGQYLSNNPTDKNWTRVQQELINLDYNQAAELYEQKKWGESRTFWFDFLNKHPLDGRVPSVMSFIGQTYFEEKKFESAIQEWSKLVSKFPSLEESSYAQFLIGETYERQLFQFETALEAYRKLTWGSYSYQAAQRIEEMKAKNFNVLTERIFHPGEEVALKVTSRNIESVKLKIYKINLLSYFKKMNTSQGLSQLDLALIEPNATFEHKLAHFEKYRLLETKLPLPEAFRAPGVYAVQVSTDQLEALTFVMVSNIALILKATRQDILVFAENMVEKKASAGTDIYISDGKKILFSGKTDANGIFQTVSENLKNIADLRVLGLQGDNVASNELPIANLAHGQGLSARGYLYTDRPAYKPGEEVHIRGILREVKESRYHFQEKEPYRLEVYGADGKRLLDTEVNLNAYGTFSSRLMLPAGCSLGTYRLKCYQKEKSTFTGDFQVQEYQLERFKLTIESSKPYYFRGETIEGVIRASYYYGEPVAHKPLLFSLSGQPRVTAQTNEKGEATFSFPTTDYNEKQLLTLSAQLGGENVYTEQQIWLATRGFELQLSTLRNVFLTQEAFDVTVKATEISGKGLETKLRYEVFHLVSQNGQLSEKKIQEGDLATSAEGRGILRLALAQSGSHRIRVQSEDRFKNTITQQYDVFVSGEDDEEKLRILSNSDQFKVGDQTALNLVWRGETALGLVTYEGERIYQAKLVSLQKGSNSLPITFESLLSPNFRLGVAVMEASKFSAVSKDFKVVRELVVKVKSDRAVYAPGQEMEVTLETTDTQGNELSAELSLAVIDEALLNIFPERLPPITDFFYGQQRSIHVATLSTNTFAYQGQTAQIDQSLLRDEQRKLLEVERNINAPDSYRATNSYLRRGVPKPQATIGFVNEEANAPPKAPMEELEKSTEAFGGSDDEYEEELHDGDLGVGQIKSLEKKTQGLKKQKDSSKGRRFKGDADGGELGEATEKARGRFLSTAYWNPSVVTSEKGITTVKVRLPSNTTSWRLVIYGIDKDVLVGKATHTIQVKKDFFVELKPPKTLVENDVPKPLVVVHNYTNKDLLVDVGLDEMQGDQILQTRKAQVQVKHGVLEEMHFPINPVKPDSITLRAWAKAEGYEDSEIKTVQVKPMATPIARGLGGLGTQSVKQTITLPAGKPYFKREFTFQFGPQLSSLLFANQFCRFGGGSVSVSNGTIAQAILNYLDSIGTTAGAEYHRYQEELTSVLAELKTTQNTDGGWGFSGVNEQNASWNLQEKRGTRASDPQVSALAIKVLVGARQKGIKDLDGTIEQGLTYLKNAFTQAQTNAEKVVLLYSMACANDADFAYVNRLYRLRYSLDPYSLAHLSLICSQLSRPELALELTQILAGQNFYEWNHSKEILSFHPWIRDPVELVARVAQAFIRAKMPQTEVEKTIQFLIASRGLEFWPSPKGNAAAIEALADYLGSYKRSGDRYEVRILVNGVALLQETIAGAVPLRAVTIPLDADQAELQIEIKGAGQFSYQALLTGWVRGMDFEDKDRYVRLEQHYMPEPLVFKGQDIPRGFSVLTGKYEPWVNAVRQLGEGHFTRMVLTPQIKDANVQEGYLVLEQPIPGGATILEPTIRGDFENYEMRDGKIFFYLGPKSAYDSIQFDLFGFLEGEYQILPPNLKSLFEPHRMSTGEAIRLTVIERNQKSNDPFKMTPDELYYLGKAHFDANDYDASAPLLKELFETYALQDAYFKETAKMLLYVALEKKNSKEVVRFFEILKERYPQLVIDFGRIIKIGLAYGDLKEFERGLQIFKATVQANFLKEGNISHILEQQGEFLSSVDFMKELHLHYPDFPVSETAYYSLSQLIYEKADQLEKDQALKKKISREDLIQMSTQVLHYFLNLHPDNPLADEASFSLANTYLDVRNYQHVIDLCNRLVNRFGTSTYLDDFLYIQGYAYFYLRKYKEAMDLFQRLIQERFWISPQEQGSSENRYLARYIMGQIFHARGEAKSAIENYKEIQDRFQDAKEAIEFFEQKELKLKEISTFKIGEPAFLNVKHRNIKDLDIKLYKVDLMKLYLLKKNLDQITRIHLAGIEPLWTRTLSFTDQYQETETKISLEIKDSGAYLVMLKGDEYDVSGMVLVSDLKIEVQEDPQSGLVRVNVLNLQKNAFESQVHVKVMGSQNQDFISGDTDLRGLFLAENIRGAATVIAQKGSSYAFYRGQKALQSRIQREYQKALDLDQAIQEQNYQNRARSSESLRQLFKNKQQGVQIEQTK